MKLKIFLDTGAKIVFGLCLFYVFIIFPLILLSCENGVVALVSIYIAEIIVFVFMILPSWLEEN